MEVSKVVAMPSLLASRKTKHQYIAYLVCGLVGLAVQQGWITETIAAAIIACVAWVTKGNIDGIAKEDAATKANGG